MTALASGVVAADRERIKAICALPEAAGQLKAAVALAVEGASLEEARTILNITASAMSPDEVAAFVNGLSRRGC